MIDKILIPLALVALRPFEALQARRVRRAHERGKFKRAADPVLLIRDPRSIGSGAVTTRRAA